MCSLLNSFLNTLTISNFGGPDAPNPSCCETRGIGYWGIMEEKMTNLIVRAPTDLWKQFSGLAAFKFPELKPKEAKSKLLSQSMQDTINKEKNEKA